METYVITGELAVKFRQWLLNSGQVRVINQFSELPTSNAQITVNRIMEVVAYKYLKQPPSALVEKTNKIRIVRPRQIASYLARKHLKMSFQRVGILMGLHHSTVKSGIGRIETLMYHDPEFAAEIENIESELIPKAELVK